MGIVAAPWVLPALGAALHGHVAASFLPSALSPLAHAPGLLRVSAALAIGGAALAGRPGLG